MPSPEAQALTRTYRQRVLDIAGLIGRRLRTVALAADTDDIDSWWDRVAPRVQQEILTGASALAVLARRYLVAHAEIEGVVLEPVVVDPPGRPQIAASTRVTGPVAFKTHMSATGSAPGSVRTMASQLSGSGQRLAMEGARETVMRTFAERDEIAGWRRVASGSPCAFCLMLVGRGAVYSKRTADFQSHDRCACTPEPLYRREDEPAEVRRLQRQWREATAGTSGNAAIAAWRAYVADQRQ
ncbi:hypothetical protein [Streptomyces aidingensis]|uniref:Phage Mu protein F like protein n=1 Tax=Streptomyces aidingensis TaxID=910347 RepID=A0A1I1PWV2_9ACTN|nr:hypothetical protein [Streptomyces aidingensis]SFD14255.1 hypothetical protein SAMN05421773_110104 [Streptomyces aidingensis]